MEIKNQSSRLVSGNYEVSISENGWLKVGRKGISKGFLRARHGRLETRGLKVSGSTHMDSLETDNITADNVVLKDPEGIINLGSSSGGFQVHVDDVWAVSITPEELKIPGVLNTPKIKLEDPDGVFWFVEASEGNLTIRTLVGDIMLKITPESVEFLDGSCRSLELSGGLKAPSALISYLASSSATITNIESDYVYSDVFSGVSLSLTDSLTSNSMNVPGLCSLGDTTTGSLGSESLEVTGVCVLGETSTETLEVLSPGPMPGLQVVGGTITNTLEVFATTTTTSINNSGQIQTETLEAQALGLGLSVFGLAELGTLKVFEGAQTSSLTNSDHMSSKTLEVLENLVVYGEAATGSQTNQGHSKTYTAEVSNTLEVLGHANIDSLAVIQNTATETLDVALGTQTNTLVVLSEDSALGVEVLGRTKTENLDVEAYTTSGALEVFGNSKTETLNVELSTTWEGPGPSITADAGPLGLRFHDVSQNLARELSWHTLETQNYLANQNQHICRWAGSTPPHLGHAVRYTGALTAYLESENPGGPEGTPNVEVADDDSRFFGFIVEVLTGESTIPNNLGLLRSPIHIDNIAVRVATSGLVYVAFSECPDIGEEFDIDGDVIEPVSPWGGNSFGVVLAAPGPDRVMVKLY